ncbi:hypothetical protein EAI_10835, partial [Harpegnathos saltator]
ILTTFVSVCVRFLLCSFSIVSVCTVSDCHCVRFFLCPFLTVSVSHCVRFLLSPIVTTVCPFPAVS